MKKVTCLIFAIVFVFGFDIVQADYSEIHCKHFIYGIPLGTPATNDLIIREIYALSSNDTTKFADWVAYRLDPETVTGDVQTKRKWKADPYLADEETLEPADYKGAHDALKTDRGHQAPLASFREHPTGIRPTTFQTSHPRNQILIRGHGGCLKKKFGTLSRPVV